MISIVDVTLQNPIPNPAADSDLLRVLPSYGAMQAATAAGFSDTVPVGRRGVPDAHARPLPAQFWRGAVAKDPSMSESLSFLAVSPLMRFHLTV
ncbi:hypothetical protein ACIA8G_21360 [Lentzea sp. NPDC051213]|uniref:hypothetical protein n=1 Tax=Lentzea sp. NPDC051213 TaxID=3364126 RepID=UPI00378CB4C0